MAHHSSSAAGIGRGWFVMRMVTAGIGQIDRWVYDGGCTAGIKGRRHEAEDEVESEGAKNGDTVDISVKNFAREEKECTVENDVEKGAVEITIIHEVLIDSRKRIEHREGLRVFRFISFLFNLPKDTKHSISR